MKKFLLLFIFLTLLIFPNIVSAQVSDNVSVSTTVDSKVSKTLSKITLNTAETLADPASHFILMTVLLVDSANIPLPNLVVIVTSNRGSIDIIEPVTTNTTDVNGLVSFKISSFVPGQAILLVNADNLINFNPTDVKFDPLPFPADVTVTVPIPFSKHEITIYAPKKEDLSQLQIDAKKLVNTGTKVNIPFLYFLLFLIIIILCPVFIILNFINVRKIRKMEKQTLEELQRIEQKNNIT